MAWCPPPPILPDTMHPSDVPDAVPGNADILEDTSLKSNHAYLEYSRALRDLTFNSKPIINGLTILAHEYSRSSNSKPVAAAVLDYFLKNLPLPVADYVPLFTSKIAYAFSTVFLSLKFDHSNPNDQRDFLRVLQTWHNVFPHSTIKEIEAAIFGNTNPIPSSSHASSIGTDAGNDHGKSQSNVWMQQQQPHLSRNSIPAYPQVGYPFHFPTSPYHQHPFGTHYPINQFIGQMSSAHQSGQTPPHLQPRSQAPHLAQPFVQPTQSSAISRPGHALNEPVTFTSGNPLDLLEELKDFLQTSSSDQLFFYRSPPVRVDLSFSGIQSITADFFSFLYEKLPLQCHVCGLRWGDDSSHRMLFDHHLDIHFRKARRNQDPSFRRSLARQWYPLGETEWKLLRLTGKPNDISTVEERKPPEPPVSKRTRHESVDPNYSDEENGDEDTPESLFIPKRPNFSNRLPNNGNEDEDDE
ncbi:hypothetical protein DI09_12p420 [Mitosporidium daphniae]|uniref:CID domain-containing protein n=1 Tax=Mitosporidium daphniae TaxID=1485682 RepID=A0A098VVM8_9MICR|nr:uncharacterized protein DI09_12p420 [Mitosporidium daphniae]KGG52874.1 hypothetical protein DI09_12p420 [Mitosporidium daphniae]|eukprot:XP_013239301.1 uncharacterized protein DI09_12p420 [Mitosporidium daphniae]